VHIWYVVNAHRFDKLQLHKFNSNLPAVVTETYTVYSKSNQNEFGAI
jgi:hypothetical protein